MYDDGIALLGFQHRCDRDSAPGDGLSPVLRDLGAILHRGAAGSDCGRQQSGQDDTK